MVCSRMEEGVIQAYLCLERSWVFISAYGPGSEETEFFLE